MSRRHFGYDDGSDDGGRGGLYLRANSGTNEMSLQESKDKTSNKTHKNIVNKAKKPLLPSPSSDIIVPILSRQFVAVSLTEQRDFFWIVTRQ